MACVKSTQYYSIDSYDNIDFSYYIIANKDDPDKCICYDSQIAGFRPLGFYSKSEAEVYIENYFDDDPHGPNIAKDKCTIIHLDPKLDPNIVTNIYLVEYVYNDQPEFTDGQTEQKDNIYNCVMDLLCTLANDENITYDMELIGEIADYAAELLTERGYKVYYPSIVYPEDGKPYVTDEYDG